MDLSPVLCFPRNKTLQPQAGCEKCSQITLVPVHATLAPLEPVQLTAFALARREAQARGPQGVTADPCRERAHAEARE